MPKQKMQKRLYRGLGYRETQRTNSINREKLKKEDKKWLRDNNYKNIGWDQVIVLYEAIEELLSKYEFDDLSLEELFLKAECIGEKYQSEEEVSNFKNALLKEIDEIEKLVDKNFPDLEPEVIDFGEVSDSRLRKAKRRK